MKNKISVLFFCTLPSVHCTVSSSGGGPIELFCWKSGDWTKLDTNVGSLSLPEGLRPVSNQKSKAVKPCQGLRDRSPQRVGKCQKWSRLFKFYDFLPHKTEVSSAKSKRSAKYFMCAELFGDIIEKRLVVYQRWKSFLKKGAFYRFFLNDYKL